MTQPDPTTPPAPVPPGVQRRAMGLLVLLLALVLGSAAYVMYARGVFEASQRLVLLADDAEGVTVGMDISFAGFPVGRVQRIELLGVGLLAGFLASVVAVIVGWALAKYAFQFSWQPPLLVPLAGSLAGGLLALGAGWWTLRGILRTPVVDTLRKASA